MKKIVVWTLCLLWLIVITGCNTQDVINTPSDNKNEDYHSDFSENTITKIKVDQIFHFTEDVVVATIDSEFRLIDTKGNIKGQPYAMISPFVDGIAEAQTKDGQYVYIDTAGNIVNGHTGSDDHNETGEMDDTFIVTYKESVEGIELWGLKDSDGNIITEPIFEYILDDKNGYYFVVFQDGAKPALVDKNGSVEAYLPEGTIDAEKINAGKNIIAYYGKSDYQLLSYDGTILNNCIFESVGNFNNDKAVATIDDKLCLVDADGNLIIESTILVTDFCPDIFNDKVAYIDKSGYLCFVNITDR